MSSREKDKRKKPSKETKCTSSEETSSSSGADPDFKPYKQPKAPNKVTKALANVKDKVVDALKPTGKGVKKEITSKAKETQSKVKEPAKAVKDSDTNNTKVVKKSVKAITKTNGNSANVGKGTDKQKLSKSKPLSSSQVPSNPLGPGNSIALREERKRKLIGNLKENNVHAKCYQKAAETVNYIKAKVEQVQLTQDDGKLPKIGEKIISKLHTYNVIKKVGHGCFGAVYSVKNEDNELFAMKAALKDGNKGLSNECRILLKISSIESPHFCQLIDHGKVPKRFNYIVVTLAEKNVSELMKDGSVSVGTAVVLAQQTLLALKDLHTVGFLHRDIKSENILVAKDEYHKVMLVDFGLSGKLPLFEEQIVGESPKNIAYFVGSLHGASLAALKCLKQSRKDDLESWTYMIFQFFGAKLPWADETDICKVLQHKERLQIDGPIRQKFFSQLPPELHTVFAYIVSLDHYQLPDYDTLFKILGFILQTSKVPKDFTVAWDLQHPYHQPPLSIHYIKTTKEEGPYYSLSNKKKNFNVVHDGAIHNFAGLIANKNGHATFVCNQKDKNGEACSRKIRMIDFYEKEIKNGDFAHISNIEGKHTCKKYGAESKTKKGSKNEEANGESTA